MNIFLAIAGNFPAEWTPLADFQALAVQNRFGVHTLTDSAENADVILFVDAHMPHDWRLPAIMNHPLTQQFPQKTLIYDDRDRPWCTLPGLYVSMPQSSFDKRRQTAVPYYKNHNEYVRLMDAVQPDLLFSFMGGRSHKIRDQIFRLSHPHAEITNTSRVNFFVSSGEPDYAEKIERQKQIFADTLLRSKFVICPRGAGTSSIRLYEAMSAGRAPVIISDNWQRPVGPDWEKCALTVREADIEKIPQLLEERERDAEAIGAQALAEYTAWFAPDVMFHHLIESCREVLQNPRPKSTKLDTQYLRCGLEDAAIRGRMTLVKLRNRLRGSG